jgi:hypothetical protein
MEVGKGHQFILINYGCDEELDKWINDQAFDNLVYKILDAEWNISKGKNISHSLGDGDILFCLDADTYITEHCMDDLEKQFNKGTYFCHPYAEDTPLAIWRDDFYAVGGWNEMIADRGEDMDMAMRLKNMGISPHYPFDSSRIIKHIDHD